MEEKKDALLSEVLKNTITLKKYGYITEGGLDDCVEPGIGYSYPSDGTGIFGIFEVKRFDNYSVQFKYNYNGSSIKFRALDHNQGKPKWSSWKSLKFDDR